VSTLKILQLAIRDDLRKLARGFRDACKDAERVAKALRSDAPTSTVGSAEFIAPSTSGRAATEMHWTGRGPADFDLRRGGTYPIAKSGRLNITAIDNAQSSPRYHPDSSGGPFAHGPAPEWSDVHDMIATLRNAVERAGANDVQGPRFAAVQRALSMRRDEAIKLCKRLDLDENEMVGVDARDAQKETL